MRFVHDSPQFLQTGKRLVHHFPIRLEVKRPGGVYLHVIRAIMGQFADARAQGVNAIPDNFHLERFELQRIGSIARSRDGQDRSRRQQSRPLN